MFAVPLPTMSSTALGEIYHSGRSGQSDWRSGYSALTATSSFADLPQAWRDAETSLAIKLWKMLGAPLEKALTEAGLGGGGHLVVLPQGILAQLPFWLAKNPETGETRLSAT